MLEENWFAREGMRLCGTVVEVLQGHGCCASRFGPIQNVFALIPGFWVGLNFKRGNCAAAAAE